MAVHEVLATDTPNSGRLKWNANDKELEDRLRTLALNVRSLPYSASGDGVADDRPAIQAAIDDCSAAGGGYVYIPAGTYSLGSGRLLLRDRANVMGAGMYSTTLRLGKGANQPVIGDERVGTPGAYAFGRVLLANLGIDGNRAENPSGQEGIVTSAYYSTFENLYIHDCQTHGIHLALSTLANQASQNRIVGCRVARCTAAGIYLDVNAVDCVISESYIHECDYGVVIKNGGVRIVNNCIFAHESAAIELTQTSYGSIVAANDINGNKRQGIHVARTSQATSGPWSSMLISGNSILGDGLLEDNRYDGIYVETGVPNGIAMLSITGNKVFTLDGSKRYRYGVNLERNITRSRCAGNDIRGAVAGYHVGDTCSDLEIDSLGGGVLGPPAVPSSGTALTNPYHVPATVHVAGGAVTEISVAGTPTGLTSGSFRIPAGQAIALSYESPPTWVWLAD